MQETQTIVPCRKFEGYAEWVMGTLHLPGGQWMICSYGGTLRLWDLTNGEQIGEDWRDGESRVIAIALSPDGKKVCCGSGDGAVRIWNIDTGKVISKWTEHTNTVSSLCWSRDSGRVVSGSYDLTTKVWDVESGEAILSIETGMSYVEAVIFSPDTTMIATGGRGHIQFLNIWDSTTGNLVANLKEHRPARASRVNCLAWTADGEMLISGAWDGSIMTWNTTTWQPISVLQGHTHTVVDIAISSNDRILASASWDDTARLWNLEDGQPIGSPLQHASGVRSTSFSTDGQLVHTASGFDDKNAYTWDVSAILRGAGLDELLSNTDDGVSDKSFLDNDATGEKLEDPHQVPEGFFDDPPDHHDHHLSPSSAREHAAYGLSSGGRTILGRFASLFRLTKYNPHDTPPQPRPLDWTRNIFSGTPRSPNSQGIALQERRKTVVDVSFAKGKRRNISGAEVRLKKEKEKNAKKASRGSTRPPQSSVTQQSGATTQDKPSSQPHADVSASYTTPTISVASAATNSTPSHPNMMIRHPSRWTRSWLFFCCTSVEYIDERH